MEPSLSVTCNLNTAIFTTKSSSTVPLKFKLTGSRSSILDSRSSKTLRIEAQVEFRDVRGRSRIYRDRSRIYRV